jgi:aminoglycoside N3'-acetyltransferase
LTKLAQVVLKEFEMAKLFIAEGSFGDGLKPIGYFHSLEDSIVGLKNHVLSLPPILQYSNRIDVYVEESDFGICGTTLTVYEAVFLRDPTNGVLAISEETYLNHAG